MTVRRTNRWVGASAAAFVASGVGMLTAEPAVLLSGVFGLAFAAYASASASAEPTAALEVERTVEKSDPEPGEEVAITVTVRNVGDALAPDLRIADGVPDGLAVADGSATRGTALRPGKQTRFSYSVVARRGVHTFDPATVVARNLSGTVERERAVGPETTLTCTPRLTATEDLPLRALTTPYTGRVETDTGGSGVEFHATREYQRGDPMSRIDWNRHARTGELATLEFREERAANVVLLVDTRVEAYLRDGDGRNAVEHATDAVGRLAAALLDSGDRVGVASLGPQFCWLDPGVGREHRARLRHLLATHDAFQPTPPGADIHDRIQLRRVRKRLPDGAQIVALTPLGDDGAVSALRRLAAYGYPVTVVSPDVTADDAPAERLARTQRAIRQSALRRAGIRVADWDTDRPLGAAVQAAARRWSA